LLFLRVKKIGDIFRSNHPIEKKFLSSLAQRSLTLSLTKDHGFSAMASKACRNFYKVVTYWGRLILCCHNVEYINQCRAIAQRGYGLNEQELNNQDAPNDLTCELSDEVLDRGDPAAVCPSTGFSRR
jgi:hypothetical protein